MRVLPCLAMAVTATTSLPGAQDPEPGISRELARQRVARVSELRYELQFDIYEGRDEVEGRVRIHFTLPDEQPAAPLVLDFAGSELTDLRVNGVLEEDARRVHNHVVLPPTNLAAGRNQLGARFKAKVAPTGTPATVYRDRSRSREFHYTLVVPADAHRLFPCFDQPDRKAVFSVRLTVPPTWVAVANGAEKEPSEDPPDGRKLYEFEDTSPLSTYLLAYAAGPFQVIEHAGGAGGAPMRLFVRESRVAELDADRLFTMHRQSLRWLERYFAQEYPFGKLDIVLVPGFPYGGMEHAGAIFYRESACVFDHQPTESELVRRSTLVYHEVSHMWFGNLVTMEWFDDLWLKEGFATFVGYHLLDALEPKRNAWLRFHQRVKPGAYRVDATPGTTPVYQELGNLADAKSAYGAIVYNKAPAVLRELHERLGAQGFRDGVRLFLARHAFGNARWQHLMAAFEQATRRDLDAWSDRWILAAGMPRVRVRWKEGAAADAEAGAAPVATSFELAQESVQGGDGTWPLRVEVLTIDAAGKRRTTWVETSNASTEVADLVDGPAPSCVILNPSDVAYGQFLLDPKSQEYLLANLPREKDQLLRAVALTALYDTVREAELAPARYAQLAVELLADERDPLTHGWLLGSLQAVLGRYLHTADRERLAKQATELLLGQLEAGMPGLELQTFRFLTRASDAPEVLSLCEDLLTGKRRGGLELGRQDRYLALAALVAAGKGGDLVASMTGSSTPAGAEKFAFLALAAAPDAATKKKYFETYLDPDEPPEQWMQQSLSYFHWPGQEALTAPYLRRALDQVEWVKAHRKIFFMPAWIGGFLGGHASRSALDVAETFMSESKDLPLDIRRKLLQSLDGLRRAVASKERWK